ncbi:hypothetical protein C3943_08470 [Lysinibacillus sp. B2A1]|nr:hypothetical protein C3943_08470 [Lysinibacillus sp. B2A1]
MNEATLLNSINDCKKILKELDLLNEYNMSRPNSLSMNKFSEEFIKLSQKKDYEKIYVTAMKNRDYDFLLNDDSFIQFSCKLEKDLRKSTIRYAYYENPRNIKTYKEFLIEFDLGEDTDGILLEDYEQYKAESLLKNSITPIRYDYDGEQFVPIHHPVSHIHIGHNNEVRIPMNKVITPLKFIIFLMGNVYRKKWIEKLENNHDFKQNILRVKNNSFQLDNKLFSVEEEKLLYLT